MVENKVIPVTKGNENQANEGETKKKQISTVAVCLCALGHLFISYQNFAMFMASQNVIMPIIIVVIVFTYFVFFIVSCIYSASKTNMCQLFFLVDNIFVAAAASIVGFVGMLVIIMPPESYVYAINVLMNIEFLLLVGVYRIVLANCNWAKWKVICTKITLLISCMAYLILAAHFIINSFPGLPEQQQQNIKQFFFLYVFGLFTLYLQIYSKITDKDGTGDLKYVYVISDGDDEQKSQIKQATEESQNHLKKQNNPMKTHINFEVLNNEESIHKY